MRSYNFEKTYKNCEKKTENKNVHNENQSIVRNRRFGIALLSFFRRNFSFCIFDEE